MPRRNKRSQAVAIGLGLSILSMLRALLAFTFDVVLCYFLRVNLSFYDYEELAAFLHLDNPHNILLLASCHLRSPFSQLWESKTKTDMERSGRDFARAYTHPICFRSLGLQVWSHILFCAIGHRSLSTRRE